MEEYGLSGEKDGLYHVFDTAYNAVSYTHLTVIYHLLQLSLIIGGLLHVGCHIASWSLILQKELVYHDILL